jgi:uncharacterized protein (TIGR03083 family)
MQISPRYDGPPLLHLEGGFVDPAVPLLRQRRRLGTLLASLDEAQWAAPSRCDAWSAKDVVIHLNTTNQFWAISLLQGLAGEPTRFLLGFDPVASPAQMVDDKRSAEPAEVLATYLGSVDALAEVIGALDEEGWSVLAEAPPGHIAARAVALHALWDGWVHERDIALPLGLPAVEEPDEVAECLRYGIALGPAFLASAGDGRTGSLAIDVTDPDARFTVELGSTVVVREGAAPDAEVTLRGRAVEVLEALSYRAPHRSPVPAEHAWMLGGLGEVFDQVS